VSRRVVPMSSLNAQRQQTQQQLRQLAVSWSNDGQQEWLLQTSWAVFFLFDAIFAHSLYTLHPM